MKYIRLSILITLGWVTIALLLSTTQLRNVAAADLRPLSVAERINKERVTFGLPPLRYNTKLAVAAQKKGQDMLKKQYWAHFGPNKESPWQFILGEDYDYSYAGENLAKGFSSARDVVSAWMASKSHRENILDAGFNDFGIAVLRGTLKGDNVFLIVCMFGTTTNSPKRTDVPVLVIVKPQNGDILPNAVTDVRGKAKNLSNNRVNIFLNDNLITQSTVEGNSFIAEVPLSQGINSITARATGKQNEPLFDEVTIQYRPVANTTEGTVPKSIKISDLVTATENNGIVSVNVHGNAYKEVFVNYNNITYLVDKNYQLNYIKGVETLKVELLSKEGVTLKGTIQIKHNSNQSINNVNQIKGSSVTQNESSSQAPLGLLSSFSKGVLQLAQNPLHFIVSSFVFLGSLLIATILIVYKHYKVLMWDILVAGLIYLIMMQTINVGLISF